MSILDIKSTFDLNTGAKIPVFGFGTCVAKNSDESALIALQQGYRHIDSAQIYQNEEETGKAIAGSKIPRDELFIVSKLWEDMYSRQGALDGVKLSLKRLGLDKVDLYLLHTPRPGRAARHQSWLGLQDAVEQGLVGTIGVSNWAPKHFDQLMKEEGVHIFPAVNQIEFHPWQQQREIRQWCKEKGVVVTAYSPLAQGARMSDETISQLAEKYGKTKAQVILNWCLQKDVVVIPKSDRESRIVENKGCLGWTLEVEDVAKIDKLDEGQKGNQGEWDPFAWA